MPMVEPVLGVGDQDWAVRCATSSAVTRVDDAEAVTFRIRKDDEVWIGRVVPHHASGAEPDQPLDLIGLFVGIIDDEVDVKSWTFLGRGGRSMHATRVPSPDGGTRIVKPSSAAENRTGR